VVVDSRYTAGIGQILHVFFVVTKLVMVRITAKSVVTLVEDELLRLNVATVYHVAHPVRKEIATALLLTVLLDMDSTVASAI
jgi:hypothetical protein